MHLLGFDKTITIINRFHFQDTDNLKDCYKKSIIKNCYFAMNSQKTINNNTINYKNIYTCKFYNKNFAPYEEWKNTQKGFTISTGDFIFLGEIKEEISSKNILEIVEQYKPNVFKVNFIKNNMDTPFLKHIKVEGD